MLPNSSRDKTPIPSDICHTLNALVMIERAECSRSDGKQSGNGVAMKIKSDTLKQTD